MHMHMHTISWKFSSLNKERLDLNGVTYSYDKRWGWNLVNSKRKFVMLVGSYTFMSMQISVAQENKLNGYLFQVFFNY